MNNSWNLKNKQANSTMHYSFMIVLIAIVIIVGHFTIWRWPPELPTLRRSVAHCTTTYRHDEASRMMNNSWNLKNKPANPTMLYSFMIVLIVIMIIVGQFPSLTLAAWASYRTWYIALPRTGMTKHREWWIIHEIWKINQQILQCIIVSW